MADYTPCNKYWGLGHDIECKHGILIDADEYYEGFDRNLIRPPCPCNPKHCKTCNGSGIKNGGDCPDCNCGWRGEIEMMIDQIPEPDSEDHHEE